MSAQKPQLPQTPAPQAVVPAAPTAAPSVVPVVAPPTVLTTAPSATTAPPAATAPSPAAGKTATAQQATSSPASPAPKTNSAPPPGPATEAAKEEPSFLSLAASTAARSGWRPPALLPAPMRALWSNTWAQATGILRPQGRVRRFFTLFVLIPTAFVFLYLALFASNIYISEARFAIRGQNAAPSLDFLTTLFRAPTSSLNDSYIVYNYIYSQDMLKKLDDKLGIRQHYSDRKRDIWFRLWSKPTQDELLRYWKWAAVATFDPDTSILSVSVKGFTPEMAQAVCLGVLENSEALVNAMNERARSDAISQAQQEVTRAEERIRTAQASLKRYRESTVILDPQAVATGLYAVVNQLEGEVTKTTAELAEAHTFMKANSPKAITLRNRLSVLEKQLATEKLRLAGALEKDAPLSALISEFQSLMLEEEFARKQLTSAMASLEAARVQAEGKTLYVESFEKPVLPDESLYPRPVLFSLIFLVAALLILGLVSLIIAAIREHAGF